jgi:hypothetical protein
MGIGVVVGIVGVVQMMSRQGEIAAAAAAAVADNPAAAGMAGVMAQLVFYAAIAVVLIQAVLAFVQWTRPNVVIPILFTVLIVGGLFIPLISGVEKPPVAAWQAALSLGITAVQLILHVAGIRGASKLDKIRYEAAGEG